MGRSRALALGLGAYALLIAVSLPSDRIYQRDEVFYVSSVKGMERGGDWLVPEYDGEPRLNKPVLFYWLVAAGRRVFGPSLGASRLVSLLAALVLVAATVSLARRTLPDPARAPRAGFVAATLLGVYLYAHHVVPEMTLAAFAALAHLEFVRLREHVRSGGTGRGPRLRFALWLGLGCMVKGPVALLPLLTVTVFVLAHREERAAAWRLVSLPSAALFLAVTAPWFAYLAHRFGIDELGHLWSAEVAARLSPGRHGPLYYAALFPLAFLPWGWFLIGRGVRFLLGREWRTPDGRAAVTSFSFVWLATHFLFFSLAVGEKHPWYAVGFAVPVALLSTPVFDRSGCGATWRMLSIAAFGSAVALAGAALALGRILAAPAAVAIEALMLAGLGVALALGRRRQWPAARMLGVAGAGLVLAVLGAFHLVMDTTRLQPARDFAAAVRAEPKPGMLRVFDPFLFKRLHLFDLGRTRLAPRAPDPAALARFAAREQPRFLALRRAVLERWPNELQNTYEVAAEAYHKRRAPGRTQAQRVVRFLRAGDRGELVEPFVLLRRK